VYRAQVVLGLDHQTPMKWKWYVTIAAVRQWMELTGGSGALEDTNPDFVRAQSELGDFSQMAKLAPTARRRSGASIYRARITLAGKRYRVDLTVATAARAEGELPHLVGVRLK